MKSVWTVGLICILLLSSCQRKAPKPSDDLRLGYLLNMTHAVPIVGIEKKFLSKIKPSHFTSGGFLINALMAGDLDIAYVGPGPYLNALSKNVDLILLGVVAYGGNSLVLKKDFKIEKPYKLRKMAVPQLGNTQDLLAKILIKKITQTESHYNKVSEPIRGALLQNLFLDEEFEYIAINPSELEVAFFTGAIDSALVSEPWGTILAEHGFVNLSSIIESGDLAKLQSHKGIVDIDLPLDNNFKKALLSINDYPTTILIVKRAYYQSHKSKVDQFLEEQNSVLQYIKQNKTESLSAIKSHLERLLDKEFEVGFLAKSFAKIKFTNNFEFDKFKDYYEIALDSFYIRYPINLEEALNHSTSNEI